MVRIINLDCNLYVGDNDKLVDADDCEALGVISSQENFVLITLAQRDGVKTYVVSKEFASSLAEALLEYSK